MSEREESSSGPTSEETTSSGSSSPGHSPPHSCAQTPPSISSIPSGAVSSTTSSIAAAAAACVGEAPSLRRLSEAEEVVAAAGRQSGSSAPSETVIPSSVTVTVISPSVSASSSSPSTSASASPSPSIAAPKSRPCESVVVSGPPFALRNQPNARQRKSYDNETRWLSPSPLVVQWRGPPGTCAKGTVDAFLAYDENPPRVDNTELQEKLCGTRTLMLNTYSSAQFQLKLTDTVTQKRRLLFVVRYREVDRDNTEHEEKTFEILSSPFTVGSNRPRGRESIEATRPIITTLEEIPFQPRDPNDAISVAAGSTAGVRMVVIKGSKFPGLNFLRVTFGDRSPVIRGNTSNSITVEVPQRRLGDGYKVPVRVGISKRSDSVQWSNEEIYFHYESSPRRDPTTMGIRQPVPPQLNLPPQPSPQQPLQEPQPQPPWAAPIPQQSPAHAQRLLKTPEQSYQHSPAASPSLSSAVAKPTSANAATTPQTTHGIDQLPPQRQYSQQQQLYATPLQIIPQQAQPNPNIQQHLTPPQPYTRVPVHLHTGLHNQPPQLQTRPQYQSAPQPSPPPPQAVILPPLQEVLATSTPQHLVGASTNGDVRLVQQLIDSGADPNSQDDSGDTPLFFACTQGHADVVAALLRCGANPRHVNRDGETALHCAALVGSTECTRELLAVGALPDVACCARYTPLHNAVWHRHAKVVEQLIEAGASVNSATVDGHTPLHLACAPAREMACSTAAVATAPAAAALPIIRMLIHHLADPAARDKTGATPAHLAARGAPIAELEIVLRATNAAEVAGTPIAATDGEGHTVLHIAAESGNSDAVELLLSWPVTMWPHVDASATTPRGTTPLHLAAACNSFRSVQLIGRICPQSRNSRNAENMLPEELTTSPEISQFLRNCI